MSQRTTLIFVFLLPLVVAWLSGCTLRGFNEKVFWGDYRLLQNKFENVDELASHLRRNSATCSLTQAPTKSNCNDGDSVLWNGLLCLTSSHPKACFYVRDSQDESGWIWRAPYRKGLDTINAFSRDMSLGFLAYVATTKDFPALHRWAQKVAAEKGKICASASDTRCELGQALRSLAVMIDPSVAKFFRGAQSQDLYWAQINLQARLGPDGYPSHLNAIHLVILRKIGWPKAELQDAAKVLWDRQPENPLFAYLAGQEETAKRLMLEQAPLFPVGDQWSFERAGSEKAWKNSMGWEFVFLYDLMRKNETN